MPSATQRGGGVQVPPVHVPAQQSALVAHVPVAGTQAAPQWNAPLASAAHTPVQQSAPVRQTPVVGTQTPGAQTPPVHTPPQHSAPVAQVELSARQRSVQMVRPVPSSRHAPVQQSALAVQTSPRAWHAPPTSQRRDASLHTPEQQWSEPPELQSSPAGRHATVRSTAQRPPSQWFEQQSASVAHVPPAVVSQASPPQTPPWHARVQQSVAVAQG